MPKGSLNVSLKGADDIFSTEESRQEQQREQVQQIPIGELFPFKNHPFKVLDDESMQRFQAMRRGSMFSGLPCWMELSIMAASRLLAVPMAWMSPVKCRLMSSIGTTWA